LLYIVISNLYILFLFFSHPTAPTEIYTLSLHDALPIWRSASTSRPTCPQRSRTPRSCSSRWARRRGPTAARTRARSTPWRRPWRSEEHTSELQSRRDLVCRLLLEKKKKKKIMKKAILSR